MIDQLGNIVNLHGPPQRIVSLVPSQTELLYHLGLDASVVGVTKFCIHPEIWHQTKKRVGGTKQLNIEVIRSLQPDLIIGNKEENQKDQIAQLQNEFPVWMSDIETLGDATSMIRSIGSITGKTLESEILSSSIEDAFKELEYECSLLTPLTVAYLIWQDPWMAAGHQTFIHAMLRSINLINCFGNKTRYPVTDLSELENLAPDVVLLSTEPFPFTTIHQTTISNQSSFLKSNLVDGEYFSWYGSRLLKAPDYFRQLRVQLNELVTASN